jgi:hypothetical protein
VFHADDFFDGIEEARIAPRAVCRRISPHQRRRRDGERPTASG